MKPPDHVLFFVSAAEGEVYMHADIKGLSLLIDTLEHLKKKALDGICDHDHLMTPSWAGVELSEKAGVESGTIVHHLRLSGWTDEWAIKHGFRE